MQSTCSCVVKVSKPRPQHILNQTWSIFESNDPVKGGGMGSGSPFKESTTDVLALVCPGRITWGNFNNRMTSQIATVQHEPVYIQQNIIKKTIWFNLIIQMHKKKGKYRWHMIVHITRLSLVVRHRNEKSAVNVWFYKYKQKKRLHHWLITPTVQDVPSCAPAMTSGPVQPMDGFQTRPS